MARIHLLDDNPVEKFEENYLYGDFIDSVFDDIIKLPKENTPFVIGINGKWGSGKTSVMRILKNKIDDKDKSLKSKQYLSIWFESWKYNDYETIGNSMIYHIFDSITSSKKAFLKIRPEFFKEMVSIMEEMPKVGGVFKGISKAIDYNNGGGKLNKFENSFNKALEVISKKINKVIIFIDDLDRCSSDSILSFFEYIKLHINIPGVIFVIGMDKEKVLDELENGSQDKKYYKEYLEKIVQHYYDLPKLIDIDYFSYLYLILDVFKDNDELYLTLKSCFVKDSFIKYFKEKTPRNIKNYFNKFIGKYNLLENEIDIKKIIALSYLDLYYNDYIVSFYKDLNYLKNFLNKKPESVYWDEIDDIKIDIISRNKYDKLPHMLQKYYSNTFGIIELNKGKKITHDVRSMLVNSLFNIDYVKLKENDMHTILIEFDIKYKDIIIYLSKSDSYIDLVEYLKEYENYSENGTIKDYLEINKINITKIDKYLTNKYYFNLFSKDDDDKYKDGLKLFIQDIQASNEAGDDFYNGFEEVVNILK